MQTKKWSVESTGHSRGGAILAAVVLVVDELLLLLTSCCKKLYCADPGAL